MIPSAELAAMQAQVNTALDLSCTIQRKTSPTRTAEGYQVDTYTTIATTTCNLAEPGEALLQNYAYRIANEETWLVRFPFNTSLRADDQIIVSGVTMRVEIVLNPQSYNLSLQALCSAQRGGAL
jgi:hypothetical protein